MRLNLLILSIIAGLISMPMQYIVKYIDLGITNLAIHRSGLDAIPVACPAVLLGYGFPFPFIYHGYCGPEFRISFSQSLLTPWVYLNFITWFGIAYLVFGLYPRQKGAPLNQMDARDILTYYTALFVPLSALMLRNEYQIWSGPSCLSGNLGRAYCATYTQGMQLWIVLVLLGIAGSLFSLWGLRMIEAKRLAGRGVITGVITSSLLFGTLVLMFMVLVGLVVGVMLLRFYSSHLQDSAAPKQLLRSSHQ